MNKKPVRAFALLLFAVVLAQLASGATIKGTIYDFGLERVNNTIVSINTVPKQQVVAKDGDYSFEVSAGSYKLVAEHPGLGLFAEEQVRIEKEGTFLLDLILMPELEAEEQLNESELNLAYSILEGERYKIINLWPYAIPVFVVIVGVVVFFALRKKGRKETAEKGKTAKEERAEELGEELNQLIKLVKEQGGRTTQKELRKHLPWSEAKTSLMIAELEHRGVVQKIKKGRGNIIILKKE